MASTFPRWKDDVEPPFVYELCRRLSQNGLQIDVLAPHAADCKTYENLDGLNIYRYRYSFSAAEKVAYQGGILNNIKKNPLLYFIVPFFLMGQFIKAYQLLNKNKYAVIHAHWIIPQGLIAALLLAFTRSNVHLICTSHGGDLFALNTVFFRWLKTWTIRRVDLLTVVSNYMRTYCHTQLVPDANVQVCSMGVDLSDKFTPTGVGQDRRNRIIFVGRLVEKKGLKYLLQALHIVAARNDSVQLDIVGDGPLRNEMTLLVNELQLQHRVNFHGAVGNEALPSYYRRSAIAVIPSVIDRNQDQEGLGLVTIEAMGCECAVIASSLEALKDIITDGENGMLVPPADPRALAGRLSQLLDDDGLLQGIAKAGRKSVLAKFDWQLIADKYMQLIESIDK